MSAQIINALDEPLIQLLLKEEVLLVPGADQELRLRLQREIKIALDKIEDLTVRRMVQTVFDEVLTVFDRLALIECKLQQLDTLLECLSILEVLQFEIRYLVEFIDNRAMKTAGISEMLHDTLDGVSYSMSHDIKRVFEREITPEIKGQSIPVVYGKILHAHGLLANCFQQTTISLLQVLNPVDSVQLFDDFEERLRQSLLLCTELSALIRVVRAAEVESSPEALQDVVSKAVAFRDGSMHYLMYRDWRAYEHLALALLTAIESNLDEKDLLHQFGCYVEVLFGHVKMRAALKEMFPNSEN